MTQASLASRPTLTPGFLKTTALALPLALGAILAAGPSAALAQPGQTLELYGGGGGGGGGSNPGPAGGAGGKHPGGMITNAAEGGQTGTPTIGGNGGKSAAYVNGAKTEGDGAGTAADGTRGGNGQMVVHQLSGSVTYGSIIGVAGQRGNDGPLPDGKGGNGGAVRLTGGDVALNGDGLYLRSGTTNEFDHSTLSNNVGEASLLFSGTLRVTTSADRDNTWASFVTNVSKGAVIDVGKNVYSANSGAIRFNVPVLEVNGGELPGNERAQVTFNVDRGGSTGEFNVYDNITIGTLHLADGGIFTAGLDSSQSLYIDILIDRGAAGVGSAGLGLSHIRVTGFDNAFELNHGNNFGQKGTRMAFHLPDVAGAANFITVDADTTMLTVGKEVAPSSGDVRGLIDLGAHDPDRLVLMMDATRPKNLQPGQSLTLINGVKPVASPYSNNGRQYTLQGRGLSFMDFTVKQLEGVGEVYLDDGTTRSDALNARYDGLNPDTADGGTFNPYAQAQLATLTLVTSTSRQNLDLLNIYGDDIGTTVQTSITGGGGTSHTGCRIRLDYVNAALAVKHTWQSPLGRSTAGVFVETGRADYDTEMYFKHINRDLNGDGETKYIGGGLMFQNLFENGLYFQTDLRAGRTENEYRVKHTPLARYDDDSHYWGAFFQGGKRWAVTEGGYVDTYGNLQYTRLKGAQATSKAGEKIDLDDIESRRFQLGARYVQELSRLPLTARVGLAWQNELDGKAGGQVDGVKLSRKPFLKGQSALIDAGLRYTAENGVFVDAGGWGGWGNQSLSGGNLTVGFTFK